MKLHKLGNSEMGFVFQSIFNLLPRQTILKMCNCLCFILITRIRLESQSGRSG